MFFVLQFAGTAWAGSVELQPGRGIADLKHSLTYLSDPSASLGKILKRFRAGEFQAVLEASALDTNYAPEAWAAVRILNATLDDGRAPDPFVLVLDLPLVSEVDAYVVRDSGFTENLLNYSIFEPFIPEDHSVTRLRTPVFEIAPQEEITLLVNFKFGPFQSFDMALETPVELEASAFSSGISHTAFYAFAISCLVFFFGFHVAMKNWIGILYAAQFSVGLGFIAYIDGLWFRFFFPDTPDLQSPVGFFFLYALSATGFLISGRSTTIDGRETLLSLALTSLAGLSAIGFIVSLLSPGTYAAFVGYVLLALMFASVFLAGSRWRRDQGEIHLTSMIISGLGVLMVVVLIAVMVIGSQAEIIPVSTSVKGIFTVLLITTMTGLTGHIINLRKKHASAVHAELAALDAEAKRSRELLETERNYTRARELASLRQRQLATASHDLKQPITSLRMNVDSLSEHLDPKVKQRLTEAFDYMEALSNEYLKETTPHRADDDGAGSDGRESVPPTGEAKNNTTSNEDEQEPYEISLVIDTVQQMFNEEAISKGLRLRRVSSSQKIAVPPLILMRIVSNLVSNAVKYTQTGAVLLGVRRDGDEIALHVLDTGPGMDDGEIAAFSQAYNKGENSEGHGLGLSVCFELSKGNGMDLECRSEQGRGTQFILKIPLAA
ncbi:ATP-binding protein [uncultured Roseibium sp.]|uniref:ATP-binding protein n=1 Tax=uncultured Roseibium sp. TaxID=1936171 RepID=UPI002593D91E|nr:ATP-binding protein [uncultured Roseibium sp.]